MAVSPLPRVLRAAVFTAVCVGLSAVAHRLMSGTAIPVWALLVAAVGVFAGACALLGRACRFARVAALMLVGEWALHDLFAVGQGTAARSSAAYIRQWSAALLCGPGAGAGASAWHGGAGLPAALRAAGMNPAWAGVDPSSVGAAPPSGMSGMAMPGVTGATMAMGQGMWGMIAVHAVAGLACAWWLWRGENAAAGMLRELAVLAMAPPRLAAAISAAGFWPPRRRQAVADERPARAGRSLLWVAYAVVRRGPPPVFAFC